MTELHDTTLAAFVDGELDAAAEHEIAARIAGDPAAQEKVRLLRAAAVLVRSAFEEPEWARVPPNLAARIAHPGIRRFLAGRRQFGSALAASLAACAAGFAGGVALERGAAPVARPAERLLADVAEYHTVYAGERARPDLAPASEAGRIAAWFADVLHRHVTIPDLASFGLAFQGARLLAIGGRPVAQLLYAAPGAAEHPLGVCIAAWSGAERTLRTERRDGVDLALWTRSGYAYVLVGWVDPARLRRIAAAIGPTLERM